MRLTLAIAALLLLPGAVASGQQVAPPAAEQVDLSAVRIVIAEAEANLGALDLLIVAQEVQLDALYAQRDAAAGAGDRDRADQFGSLIDRMNLTLTRLEAERDGIASLITTLQDQVAALNPVAAAPADFEE